MAEKRVSLAIYTKGTSLVQERRSVLFEAGLNTIHFTDVAETIDPTSVQFVSLSDPVGTVVLEQSYLFDLVNNSALLRRYLDQIIEVVLADGKTYSGKMLSGTSQDIILQTDEGKVAAFNINKIYELHFPAVPGGLTTRPTLRWLVRATQSSNQDIELTYLTNGLNWSATYILLLSLDEKSFDLTGWVKIINQSGTAYPDAKVKLIAGEVNRLPPPDIYAARAGGRYYMEEEADYITPPRDISQYKLYEINRPVSLAPHESKQIEFVSATKVKVSQVFRYVAEMIPEVLQNGQPYRDPYQWVAASSSIQFFLEFTTGAESGLDAELPYGVVRVYQPDIDGAAILIGENVITQTAKEEKVSISLGKVFDLIAECKRLRFEWIALNMLEETFEIRLRNRKDSDSVEISVLERLFRWVNWEITAASMAYRQIDANLIEFLPQVAPGEEVVITYTVRYDFPPEPDKN